jgi:hypothetical protein
MPPGASSGRKAQGAAAKNNTKSSSSSSATRRLLTGSVLVALLAVGLPPAWRWWQQHSSLRDRHAVLEVARELQFAQRYRLGTAFDLAWANGSISVWPAGAAGSSGESSNALWCVNDRSID